MSKVPITRMELLAKREQIALAQQGLELLQQKRSALLRELMRVADSALVRYEELQATAVAARRALVRAEVMVGETAVRSAALATRGQLALEMQTVNVMGVSVPVIEQQRASRSQSERITALPNTSVTIDEAAAAFESEVEHIIDLAESELRLRRLADEIQRTSRRANALEQVVIPQLEAQRDMIQMALDERERAEHFRLKRMKRQAG
ncbi:MAG: V-type ATP synthase subunit D [Ardenticatenaceae bacterium]|nr:V-type ATP synthase subunit D [Ardenticatenaceae bacterium]